jgi:Formyl transferase
MEGRTQLPCSPNGRAPVSGGGTLAGVTQTIVRGHSGQRGVPAGPACNECHVRAFVKLSDVTDTVAATRIGFGPISGHLGLRGGRLCGRPGHLEAFGGRCLNTHPAVLPSFPGTHGVPDALAHGVKTAGCTVFIVDEGVDTGLIVAQASPLMTLASTTTHRPGKPKPVGDTARTTSGRSPNRWRSRAAARSTSGSAGDPANPVDLVFCCSAR